eukprot:gene11317-23679_t
MSGSERNGRFRTNSHSFLDLPTVVVVKIFSNYLTVLDLARFDSATTNKSMRGAINRFAESLVTINFGTYGGISGEGMEWISKRCPNLTNLKAAKSTALRILDNTLLVVSERCPGLTSLDLSSCFKITDIGIGYIVSNCTDMREMTLADCYNITDVGVNYIAECCEDLEFLDLSSCSDVTDISLVKIAKNCPLLVELNVQGCHRITDKSLIALGQYCHRLQILNLQGCVKITSVSIQKIAIGCPNLQSLILSGCQITDKAVIALSNSSNNIHTLDLASCKLLSDFIIPHLILMADKLKLLDLSYCINMTSETVIKLPKLCPNTIFIGLNSWSTQSQQKKKLDHL